MGSFLLPEQFLEILNHGENQNEHRANQADGENCLQEPDRNGDQKGHNRSLAFTSPSRSVPYELFTNFLAGSYGLLALIQVDGCFSRSSESRFGNGYLDFFRDVSSQRDFSGLRRDSLAP